MACLITSSRWGNFLSKYRYSNWSGLYDCLNSFHKIMIFSARDIEKIKEENSKENELKNQKHQKEMNELRKKFRIVEQQRNQLSAQIEFEEKQQEHRVYHA